MALPIPDFYAPLVAVDPVAGGGEGRLLPNAEFQIFNVHDVEYSTPLRVYEHESGLEIPPPFTSNQFGATQNFRVEGDPTEVIIRSGPYKMRTPSYFGALRAAGFDPEQIAEAAAAAPIAAEAAGLATTAAADAAEARDQAVEAAENLDLSHVDARVVEYLTENPPSGVSTWNELGGKPASIAAGASPALARSAIGLGSAATQSAGAFASSVQGEKADSAVQPAELDAVAGAIPALGTGASQAKPGDWTPGLADLPPGSVFQILWDGAPSTPRGTARTDIHAWWIGGPDTRPTNALPNDLQFPDLVTAP